MIAVVETTPRLTLDQLRQLESWPSIDRKGSVTITVEVDEVVVSQYIEFDHDETPFGRRAWLVCPGCRTRRRHLFVTDDGLRCRVCAKLRYAQQLLPPTSWRDTAVEVLRAARRARRPVRRKIRPSELSGLHPFAAG